LKKARFSKQREEAEFYISEKDIWIKAIVDPVTDERGMISSAIHIVRDNTDRRRVEEALRESEEQHRAIFTSAVDGIIYADRKANIVEVNPAFTEITGIPRQEVVGKNAFTLAKRFAKPKDIPKLLKAVRQALEGKPMELYELEINNKIVEVSTPALKKGSAGITGVIRDVTERKKAEEALKVNEKCFRDIFESTLIGLYQTTPDGRILMANPALVRMLGYKSFKELAARNLEQEGFEPAYPRSQFKEQIEAGGQIVGLESAWTRRDGTTLFMRESARAIRDSAGNTLYYQGTMENITENKQMEEELQEAELKYRIVADNTRDWEWWLSPAGEFIYISPSCSRITGYDASEFMDNAELFRSIIYPADLPVWDNHQCETSKGEVSPTIELRVLHRDGSERWIEHICQPVFDDTDTFQGSRGSNRDITERKKAEEVYRSLVDHSLQGLVVFQDGRVVFTNQAMVKITGYSVDEMLALPPEKVRAFVHPEDRELVWNRYKERLEGKLPPERYELRGIRKDGSVRWLEIDTCRVEYQSRPAIQTAFIDITERKEAEEALRESEEKFRNIFESSLDGIFLLDLESKKFTLCNQAFLNMLGYTKKEFKGLGVKDIHTEESLSAVFEQIGMFEKGEMGVRKDTTFKKKDGSICFADLSPSLITIAGKRYILVICKDITERRKDEKAIRESEAQLKHAQEVAHVGSWFLDLKTSELIWSEETYRIFGVPVGRPLLVTDFLSCTRTTYLM
jgi:PAS domain S-box-containing protein